MSAFSITFQVTLRWPSYPDAGLMKSFLTIQLHFYNQSTFSNCNCTSISAFESSFKAFLTNKSQSGLASVQMTYCRHSTLKYVIKFQILYGSLGYLSESTNCAIQEQMLINKSCIIRVLCSLLCCFRSVFPDYLSYLQDSLDLLSSH